MSKQHLVKLCALVMIIVIMTPASFVQALSNQKEAACPPYNPEMAEDVAFLSQLSPNCRSVYYKTSRDWKQAQLLSPQSIGGPDIFGYAWDDTIPPSWIDTTGGTNTGLSGSGGNTGAITLPFPFRYYDNEYSSVYITSSGYLSFHNTGITNDQDYIPAASQPNDVIAPYWTPTYIPAGAWVHYQSGGTSPNRYFVVEWHDLTGYKDTHAVGSDDKFRFEVILYENGNIDFQYASMSITGDFWCGTAGIENSTGSDGLNYVGFCNYPPSFMTVRFTRPATGSFIDVSMNYWAEGFIERLYNAGITGGCNVAPLKYCPETIVTRAQMAVFLLRGIHGSSYSPPVVGASTGFADVPTTYWAAPWIKELAAEGITGGCGNGNYCPEYPVTRDQMAIFLLRSKNTSSYSPPDVAGNTGFGDVPTTYWAAPWIKELVTEGITAGCGGGNYCPATMVTRSQMAVFLVRTFGLP